MNRRKPKNLSHQCHWSRQTTVGDRRASTEQRGVNALVLVAIFSGEKSIAKIATSHQSSIVLNVR